MRYKSIPVELAKGAVLYYDITRNDIVAFGHDGFYESCENCRYPVCGFEKA